MAEVSRLRDICKNKIKDDFFSMCEYVLFNELPKHILEEVNIIEQLHNDINTSNMIETFKYYNDAKFWYDCKYPDFGEYEKHIRYCCIYRENCSYKRQKEGDENTECADCCYKRKCEHDYEKLLNFIINRKDNDIDILHNYFRLEHINIFREISSNNSNFIKLFEQKKYKKIFILIKKYAHKSCNNNGAKIYRFYEKFYDSVKYIHFNTNNYLKTKYSYEEIRDADKLKEYVIKYIEQKRDERDQLIF